MCSELNLLSGSMVNIAVLMIISEDPSYSALYAALVMGALNIMWFEGIVVSGCVRLHRGTVSSIALWYVLDVDKKPVLAVMVGR